TSKLENDFKTGMHIERLNKSGGVVTRSEQYKRKIRVNSIREYFYGTPATKLSPHSIVVKFEEVTVIKIGGEMRTPESALPIGATTTVDPCSISEVEITEQLMHSVLALSHATTKETILMTNVCGFIYVSSVDKEKKELTVLTPSPGKLPGKFLILGSLK